MPQSAIFRRNQSEPYYFKERCIIRELSNSELDPAVSIAEATVAVNTSTCWHRLAGTWERYIILAGEGRVELGDDLTELVKKGDTVVIPADTPQRITNIGNENLIFLAICSPRFQPSVYIDLEGDKDC